MVVALQNEARTLLPRGDLLRSATVAIGTSLALRLCGMGPEKAAEAARALLADGATALVSYGLAGALAPELAPGTLLLPERVAFRGEDRVVDLSWRQRIEQRLSPRPSGGLLLTLPQPLTTAADKARVHRETGADAVDMESGAVLEVAAAAGVPGLVLRAVVDGAATSLPQAAVAGVDAYGQPRAAPLLRALLRRPREIADLLRLGGDLRLALNSLKRAWSQLGAEGLAA